MYQGPYRGQRQEVEAQDRRQGRADLPGLRADPRLDRPIKKGKRPSVNRKNGGENIHRQDLGQGRRVHLLPDRCQDRVTLGRGLARIHVHGHRPIHRDLVLHPGLDLGHTHVQRHEARGRRIHRDQVVPGFVQNDMYKNLLN